MQGRINVRWIRGERKKETNRERENERKNDRDLKKWLTACMTSLTAHQACLAREGLVFTFSSSLHACIFACTHVYKPAYVCVTLFTNSPTGPCLQPEESGSHTNFNIIFPRESLMSSVFFSSGFPTKICIYFSMLSTYSIQLNQCFWTAGPRPGTGPWHQL